VARVTNDDDATSVRGVPLATYVRTRTDLHRVAEHVVSATLNRESGHVALRAVEGGFGTPEFGEGRSLSVVGTELVDDQAGARRVARLTTVGELASFVGSVAGSPDPPESWSTPVDLDAPLEVDAAAAGVVAWWFGLGAAALSQWRTELAEADVDADPTPVKLWPEHFDIAISAAEVNYGASPGDESHPAPYLYVGPWTGAPEGDPEFWNAPFGALLDVAVVGSAADALAFFRAGRDRLAAAAGK